VAIGFGIIGTGKHGARYLKHMVDVPGLRLAAIARRDRAAGERQAADYGCRYHAAAEDLIADPAVEAVALVVPPTRTERFAVAAARAGKALLIEKPLAPTVAECRRIAEAVDRAGVTAMVAHTLRFNEVVQTLRAALPAIGPLHAIVLTQRFEVSTLPWLDRRVESGGGIVLHTGVHGFDLVRYLSGREAVRVAAVTNAVATRDTEDNFSATIELERGVIASVSGSRATAGRSGSLELAGRDGQLVGDHIHGIAARLVGATRTELPRPAPVMTVPAAMQELAAAITAKRAPAISLADGAGAVAIAEACYRSFATGRAEAVERW
jgi:predicted dehydrogenase